MCSGIYPNEFESNGFRYSSRSFKSAQNSARYHLSSDLQDFQAR